MNPQHSALGDMPLFSFFGPRKSHSSKEENIRHVGVPKLNRQYSPLGEAPRRISLMATSQCPPSTDISSGKVSGGWKKLFSFSTLWRSFSQPEGWPQSENRKSRFFEFRVLCSWFSCRKPGLQSPRTQVNPELPTAGFYEESVTQGSLLDWMPGA